MRMVNPAVVFNTIVFDCLEPPPSESLPQVSASVSALGGGEAGGGRSSGGALGGGGGGDDDASMAGGAEDDVGCGGRPVARVGGGPKTPRRRRKGGSGPRDSSGGGASTGSETGEGSMRRSRSTPDVAGLLGSSLSMGAGGGASSDARFRYFEDLPAWYCPRSPDDTTLVFESRFESGNLRRALQVHGDRRQGGIPVGALNSMVLLLCVILGLLFTHDLVTHTGPSF